MGVTVHNKNGSVHTLVLTSRFCMVSVQQGEKTKQSCFFIKQWFTSAYALNYKKPFNISLLRLQLTTEPKLKYHFVALELRIRFYLHSEWF